ncbi:helix-turn-helix domain-containing protein [Kitasatospora sp. NPDC049285]|uniref:helix-turn-helix domain-containing protein n=1 Tax=Kitasatospora sp. NPDC049285 TaxID=3157096 RepID=UPI003427BF26
MARWEPNAGERLERAALDLFVQQGYERTTVAEIAERAGLGKSTFFRHFTDKREVLFGGDVLGRLLAEAVAAAPAGTGPLEAVAAALDAAATYGFRPERRQAVRDRQQVIAAHPELTERELLKRAGLVAALTDALRARDVPAPTAALAAELASLALRTALAEWTATDDTDFSALARRALATLHAAAADL